MDITDLELTLRSLNGAYTGEMRLTTPGSQAPAVLVADAPLVLNPDVLLSLALDTAAYGRALTEQIFRLPALYDAWRHARALADGAITPVRLRLCLPEVSDDLHALRWETLRDPISDAFVATDARLRLTRSIVSSDTRPLSLLPKPALRALIVVASPRDLGAYGLSMIDADGEVERLRRALGDIPMSIIGDHEDAVKHRATPDAIQAALSEGPAILCLICHGRNTDEGTLLCLEDDDGYAAHVPGSVLAEMLAQLTQPPLLAVVMACEGGGVSHQEGALAALGPRLALAGLGGVVAMQAKLSTGAARAFLPALFRELTIDGSIDRAVSVGRAALRNGNEWWVPALWLRMREGLLWRDEEAKSTDLTSISIRGDVGTLQMVNVSGGRVGAIVGSYGRSARRR